MAHLLQEWSRLASLSHGRRTWRLHWWRCEGIDTDGCISLSFSPRMSQPNQKGPLEHRAFTGRAGCPDSSSAASLGHGGLSLQNESIVVALTSSQVAGRVSTWAVSVVHLTLPGTSLRGTPVPASLGGTDTSSSVVSAWAPGHRSRVSAQPGMGLGLGPAAEVQPTILSSHTPSLPWLRGLEPGRRRWRLALSALGLQWRRDSRAASL